LRHVASLGHADARGRPGPLRRPDRRSPRRRLAGAHPQLVRSRAARGRRDRLRPCSRGARGGGMGRVLRARDLLRRRDVRGRVRGLAVEDAGRRARGARPAGIRIRRGRRAVEGAVSLRFALSTETNVRGRTKGRVRMKRSRRWAIVGGLAFALAALVVGVTAASGGSAKKKKIVIGVSMDMTDGMKPFNSPALAAAQIWARKITAAGGPKFV